MTGMHARMRMPEGLLTLAERQGGALSVEQLTGFQVTDRVTRRMVADGRLRPLARGIYAIGPDTWLQQAWAGILIGGPRAVLGGAAAGYLQGFLREPPATVLVFATGRRPRDGRWRFVRSRREGSGEPPRTRPAQTVVDLSAELEPDAIVSVLAEAVGRRGVRPGEVSACLAATERHPHRRLVEELVSDVAAGALSPLEVRYLRQVERAHGLPAARRQRSPYSRYHSDVWYADYGVMIELDGRSFHQGQAALDDMSRDNDHQLVGIITLRFGWRHVVGDPCAVATAVSLALREKGWPGRLRPCRSCRSGQADSVRRCRP